MADDDTITVTCITNHKVPVDALDPDSDDDELVTEAFKEADPCGQKQEMLNTDRSAVAAQIRKQIDRAVEVEHE